MQAPVQTRTKSAARSASAKAQIARQKSSAAHGGKRFGQGRPPSSINVRNREIAVELMENARKKGLPSPLEAMWENYFFFHDSAKALRDKLPAMLAVLTPLDVARRNKRYQAVMDLFDKATELVLNSQLCASQAAPYCHARINAITIKGDKDHPIPIQVLAGMTPREAAEAYTQSLGLIDTPDDE